MSEGNGVTYEQVTSNTLVKYGPNVDYPEYQFIYPHSQGTWDTPGSDGLYWKGCMSCHSSLGAYNYAAYNSRERLAGTVAAAVFTEAVGGMIMNIPAAKTSTNILSAGEHLRIENAATRINKSITVVGSRASGKAGAYSDWDYVIEGGLKNSREWSKIKNSLPGARSTLDNTPRNIDILSGPVRKGSPQIRIDPR